MKIIDGFSKFSKVEKLNWLASLFNQEEANEILEMSQFWHHENETQKIFDEFSENTVSNYFFPYGLAPNFIINDKVYTVPMVIEESSVVAAASNAAKFWSTRGGFKAKIHDVKKIGHVHFFWTGNKIVLNNLFESNKNLILDKISPLSINMKKRGGGILDVKLKDLSAKLQNYFQFELEFNTCDAMGANFINSILEEFSSQFMKICQEINMHENYQPNMCILSNYTPECLVEAWVECTYDELSFDKFDGKYFANKIKQAVEIATTDTYRAVTHNKGIMNGVDAVVLATGNDFRAIEACIHAYAAKDGQYKSLSYVELSEDKFKFSVKLPLALGTVGGLTSLHPMAKKSLLILNSPNSRELMSIVASVGLAQNFSALKSLTTTGIQKGHMKMHLLNICKQLEANESEIKEIREFFEDKIVSYTAVRNLLLTLRLKQ